MMYQSNGIFDALLLLLSKLPADLPVSDDCQRGSGVGGEQRRVAS